jgi:serine/threonine-protein kinase
VNGIPGGERFARVEPIRKGQSGDRKYRVETDEGEALLVRIGDAAEFARKKAEYEMLERAFSAGVPTPRPLGFGLCADKNTYAIVDWCEGIDAEALLPSLTASERRALGEKSGALLRLLHLLPAPDGVEPWSIRFRRKVAARVEAYDAMPERLLGADLIRDYLTARQSLLDKRPQTFNHGDYNAGNLIVASGGAVRAIDFNAYNGGYGDPWWELDADADPDYLNGQLAGYFAGNPPYDYFPMCAYYAAYGALAALCDALSGESGAPEDGVLSLERVLAWFDGMRADVPSWYHPIT